MTTPPEHATLVAAGWEHTAQSSDRHRYDSPGPVDGPLFDAVYTSGVWVVCLYVRGDVYATRPHRTLAAAIAQIRHTALALALDLPEVLP
jgi:hypothetical protein